MKMSDEQQIQPSFQADTIWKTENDDIFLIVGADPIKNGNFHAYALWKNEYHLVDFTCGYARQAELVIPGANGIVEEESGAVFLVVGTYHIKEDLVTLDAFSEDSAGEFLQGRKSIEIKRYSYDELIDKLPFSLAAQASPGQPSRGWFFARDP